MRHGVLHMNHLHRLWVVSPALARTLSYGFFIVETVTVGSSVTDGTCHAVKYVSIYFAAIQTINTSNTRHRTLLSLYFRGIESDFNFAFADSAKSNE